MDKTSVTAASLEAMLTSSLVLEEVLPAVARRIAEGLDVWECDLYEYDAERRVLVCSAVWGQEMTPEDEAFVGSVVELAERGSYQSVIDDRLMEAAVIDDPDMADEDRRLMREWDELSSLAAPLVYDDRVIGCVTLIEKRTPRRFTEEDRAALAGLMVPASVAIHNARMYRREEEQHKRLESLLDSSRALTSTVVLEDVLSIVARKAAQALGSPECVIYEYDDALDALVYRSMYPPENMGDDIGTAYPLRENPADRGILRGRRIVEESLSDEALDPAVRADMEEHGETTCLNVPLVFKDRPLGIMVLVESEIERHFTPDEIELVQGLGEQAAVAIHYAQQYRRQEDQAARLVALLEASRTVTGSLDSRHIVMLIGEQTGRLLGEPGCGVEIFLRGDAGLLVPFGTADGNGAVRAGDAGDETDANAGERGGGDRDDAVVGIPPDDLVDAALVSGSAVQHEHLGGRRLVVPLALKGRAVGVIDVRSTERGRFSPDEIELVQILANQASVAIENAQLYLTIEQQAVTDGLTGLFNRRRFYERLEDEIARAGRYDEPLSLIMLDLDDFKGFNDRYGHPAGDEALRRVGAVLITEVRRRIDVAARLGGEEFGVLLPNTSAEGAMAAGRRIRDAVAAASGGELAEGDAGARTVGERIRRDIEATSLAVGGGAAHITVSAGIAGFPGQARTAEELVRNADKALYLAKRLGKNRVEVYQGSPGRGKGRS